MKFGRRLLCASLKTQQLDFQRLLVMSKRRGALAQSLVALVLRIRRSKRQTSRRQRRATPVSQHSRTLFGLWLQSSRTSRRLPSPDFKSVRRSHALSEFVCDLPGLIVSCPARGRRQGACYLLIAREGKSNV